MGPWKVLTVKLLYLPCCSHHNIHFCTNSCSLQNTPYTSQTFTNNFNEMELFSLYHEVSINKVQSQTCLLPLYLATKNFVFQQQNVRVQIIKQKKVKLQKIQLFYLFLAFFYLPFIFIPFFIFFFIIFLGYFIIIIFSCFIASFPLSHSLIS